MMSAESPADRLLDAHRDGDLRARDAAMFIAGALASAVGLLAPALGVVP